MTLSFVAFIAPKVFIDKIVQTSEGFNPMDTMVDIEGIPKFVVLTALYNASRPVGSGWLRATHGPLDMNFELAAWIVENSSLIPGRCLFDGLVHECDNPLYFYELYGRPLRVDLSEDEFDANEFDQLNGGSGTAKQIVSYMRQTGEIDTTTRGSLMQPMSHAEAYRWMGEVPGRLLP